MRLVLLLVLALAASGCAPWVNEVLPLSRSIVGNAQVVEVRTVVHSSGRAEVAALDERVLARAPASADPLRRLPLADLVTRSIEERVRAHGLTSGRPIRIIAEIDHAALAGIGGAIIGRDDRLSGTAFIRDAATEESLGQLYISVRRDNGGLVATALRGGSVRERMAADFAERVARALSGRRNPPR